MKIIIAIIAVLLLGVTWLFVSHNGILSSENENRYQESAGGANEEMIEVYDGIAVAKSTRYLILSGRGLTGSLKAEVAQLTELETLDMSNNSLTGIPAEVGQLSKLKVLNLSNNMFTGLPAELGNLQNLQTLNLTGNNYTEADLETIRTQLPADVNIITD